MDLSTELFVTYMRSQNFNINRMKKVILKLRTNGVVVLESFFSDDQLLEMKQAESFAFSLNEMKVALKHDYDGLNKVVLSRHSFEKYQEFKRLKEIFCQTDLEALVRVYLFDKTRAFTFFEFWKTSKTNDMILDGNFQLHFDMLETLKFQVYLNDVSAADGPTIVHPGSHIHNRSNRNQQLASGAIKHKLEVLKSAYQTVPTSLIAPKGSLIIFDSNISHCATHVASNNVRTVFRALAHAEKY